MKALMRKRVRSDYPLPIPGAVTHARPTKGKLKMEGGLGDDSKSSGKTKIRGTLTSPK